MKKTVILTILDGWGIGRPDRANPIYSVQPATIKYCQSNFPAGALQAAGIAVGLPWEERGNSEMGHLTIGAGRTIYQHYPRISLSIKDGSFFKNTNLLEAFSFAKSRGRQVHLIGLISESNIDSSIVHLEALIKMAEAAGADYYLHLITDGIDSSPQSAASLIDRLSRPDRVASLFGRYYAMDEDDNWDRIRQCYEILTNPKTPTDDYRSHLTKTWERNLGDEYVEPSAVGSNFHPVKSGDSLIFFNFREDSSRELLTPFIDPDFREFPVIPLNNLFVLSFTRYSSDFQNPVAFSTTVPINTLGQVIADNDLTQLRIGETLKYSSLTYFFNGFREAPFKNEYRVLLPSGNTPHPENTPELRAQDITNRALQSINEKVFNFILVNYANPDIIGHTGSLSAAEKAVSVIDKNLNQLLRAALDTESALLVVGSHGNLEYMVDPLTGRPQTENTTNPVPFFLIDKKYQIRKDAYRVESEQNTTIGILSDIAPTILNLLDLPTPPEITGQNLLKYLL